MKLGVVREWRIVSTNRVKSARFHNAFGLAIRSLIHIQSRAAPDPGAPAEQVSPGVN
jgi:hypothetical protein